MKMKKAILGICVALFSVVGLTNIANAIDPIAQNQATTTVETGDFNGPCTLSNGSGEG